MKPHAAAVALAAAIVLAGLGLALLPAPAGEDARAAATRFAIRYCYAQYRAQADVDRCLVGTAPADRTAR